jgi:hypothetical protein
MKKKYDCLTLFVPHNIQFDRVFDNLDYYVEKHNKSNTLQEKERIKESVYLFLYFLYPSPNYIEKYRENGYYKPILSVDFDSITRNLKEITVDILSNPEYPIIEINPSYKVGVYSKSYKLRNDFFVFCKRKEIIIQSRISKNYLNKINEKIEESNLKFLTKSNSTEYEYLFKHFQTDIITIDDNVHDLISQIEQKLLQKVERCINREIRELSLIKVKNKILRMKRCVSLIKNGEYNPTVSINNNRLYSIITESNKEIRRFIKINGNKINEIDIKNSHLYILSNVINNKFYNIDNQFSIYKIDKILSDKLNNKDTYKKIRIKLLYNKIKINKDNNNTIPYMSGRILNQPDIHNYISLPFREGLYEYLNTLLFNGQMDREKIKKNVMNFVNLAKFRENNLFIREMKDKFPNVNEFVELINGVDSSKGWLAVLLQRTESYLLLDVGVKKVLEELPKINFLTVHDSLLVEEGYSGIVKKILEDSITEITGVPIGFSIRTFDNTFDDVDDLVEDKWMKIKKSVRKERRKLKKIS